MDAPKKPQYDPQAKPALRVPLAQSVTAEHIVQAYVYQSERQQKRIELYGRMNLEELQTIGQPTGKVDTRGPKKPN